MTRRGWILAVGTGLCCGLLPACTHTAAEQRLADPAMLREPQPVAELEQVQSPYHATPVSTAAGAGAESEQLKQAVYPPLQSPAGSPVTVAEAPLPDNPAAGVPPEVEALPLIQVNPESPRTQAEDPPLVVALRCFLDKRPAEAVHLLERYDKVNQELLLCLLPVAARLSGGNLAQASPQEMTNLVNQLEGLLPPLRSRAELLLDKMCFCSWIGGYGRYEPLAEGHSFHVGEPVQVYVELQNVSNQLRGEAYVTQLASSVIIFDLAHHKVWQHDFGDRDYRDLSQTLRHDYFNNCRFCVPEIPPGQYTLCIEVQDVSTKRIAKRSLDFRVTTIPARDSQGEPGR
jgi:hypothetical protein